MSDKKNTMVSVCMVTYKHEAFIRDAIEGVLNQKVNFKVNLLIGDDNSPDNTSEIINDIICNHPNGHWVTYIKREKNIGMMPNFIDLLNLCKGKYIALCDGDDYWTDPFKLQKQVDLLESNKNLGIVYTNHNVVDNFSSLIKENSAKQFSKFSKDVYDVIANCPRTLTVVFRKRFLKDIPLEDFNIFKQGDHFLFSYLAYLSQIEYMELNTGNYRLHTGGVFSSMDQLQKLIEQIEIREQLISYFKIIPNEKLRKKMYAFYKSLIYLSITKMKIKVLVKYSTKYLKFFAKYE